jgi:hypothetical protein
MQFITRWKLEFSSVMPLAFTLKVRSALQTANVFQFFVYHYADSLEGGFVQNGDFSNPVILTYLSYFCFLLPINHFYNLSKAASSFYYSYVKSSQHNFAGALS